MAQQDTLGIFTGGQMTDLPPYTGSIDLTALLEIVAPGNSAFGVNYSITLADLIAQIQEGLYTPTFVIDQPTYNSVPSDIRILVGNTGPLSTDVLLRPSAEYLLVPILVKDVTGQASDVNPITVTFSGGELMDGLSQVQIINPYGFYWFNPLAAGGFYGT